MRLKSRTLLAESLLAISPMIVSLPFLPESQHPCVQLTYGDTVRAVMDESDDSSAYPITMNFVGDIMLSRQFEGDTGIIRERGLDAVFAPTKPLLGDNADITVANIENPFTDRGTPHPTKLVVLKSSPSNVAGLVYAGIDVVTIANNHIFDYGPDGLQQTRDVLEREGIVFSGAGADADEAYTPAFFTRSNVRFAFVAQCDLTGEAERQPPFLDAGPDKAGFAKLTATDLARQIDTVRNKADLVVAELHTGVEYSFTPDAADIKLRQGAIDCGADLVICHHPHIVQGFQVYRGKLIAHSLGNFVFDLSYPETMSTVILNTVADRTGFRSFSVTPVFIDHCIPVRAGGEFGLHLLNYLARCSKNLGTYLAVDSASVTATIVADTLLMDSEAYRYACRVQGRQQGNDWVSQPLRLTRSGNLSSVDGITPSGEWWYRVGRDVVWFGNFEDEGCSLWNVNGTDRVYDTATFHAGRRSLLLKRGTAAGAITANFCHRLMCDTVCTRKYTIYGWMKTLNAVNATMKVKYYTTKYFPSNGAADIGTQVDGTTDWTFYQREFAPTDDSLFFNMALTGDMAAAGESKVWFDDVGIIAWSDWKKIDSSEAVNSPNDYYWIQIRTGKETTAAAVTYTETRYIDAATSVRNHRISAPAQFMIAENRRNIAGRPMNTVFTLANRTRVTLAVYDFLGRKKAGLVDRVMPAGRHSTVWNPGPAAAGVYLWRLKAGTDIRCATYVNMQR